MPIRPYTELKVLDLSRVLASPFASYMLALLGADVIKIEDPQGGDVMRTRSPGTQELADQGLGTGFLSQNSNKRSLTLNLRTEQGQALFRQLASTADVVVENLRTGTMESYGLGYEDLKKVNPRLVYCSITGYGHTGEKQKHPAYDPVIQAASGVMSLTGTAQSGPIKAGIPAIDYATGMAAAFGIASALLHRERCGEGQHVDVSMLDTALVLMSSVVTDVLTLGRTPAPIGNTLGPNYSTNQLYQGQNGSLWISAPEPHQQQHLWRVLGIEKAAADEKFLTEAARIRHKAELTAIIEESLATRPVEQWEELLNEAGVPAMRLRSLPEILQHPQLKSRNLFHSFADIPGNPEGATVPMLPFGLSSTPASVERRPPQLSEHTNEILSALGLDSRQISQLRETGVI